MNAHMGDQHAVVPNIGPDPPVPTAPKFGRTAHRSSVSSAKSSATSYFRGINP